MRNEGKSRGEEKVVRGERERVREEGRGGAEAERRKQWRKRWRKRGEEEAVEKAV